jgi:hypothetical protein
MYKRIKYQIEEVFIDLVIPAISIGLSFIFLIFMTLTVLIKLYPDESLGCQHSVNSDEVVK